MLSNPMPFTDPELLRLLERAAKHQMTAAERQEQRRSYVLAEVDFGSDADEAAYRSAFRRGDAAEMKRLDAEGQERRRHAAEYLDRIGC